MKRRVAARSFTDLVDETEGKAKHSDRSRYKYKTLVHHCSLYFPAARDHLRLHAMGNAVQVQDNRTVKTNKTPLRHQ